MISHHRCTFYVPKRTLHSTDLLETKWMYIGRVLQHPCWGRWGWVSIWCWGGRRLGGIHAGTTADRGSTLHFNLSPTTYDASLFIKSEGCVILPLADSQAIQKIKDRAMNVSDRKHWRVCPFVIQGISDSVTTTGQDQTVIKSNKSQNPIRLTFIKIGHWELEE